MILSSIFSRFRSSGGGNSRLYDLHDEDPGEETDAQVSPGIAVIEVLGNGERQPDIQFV